MGRFRSVGSLSAGADESGTVGRADKPAQAGAQDRPVRAGFFVLNPKSYNDPERQPDRFRRDCESGKLDRSRCVRSRGCRFFFI